MTGTVPTGTHDNRCLPRGSALARYFHHRLHKLTPDGKAVYGIKALNKEQKFALELLLDESIQVVTLVGKAGTGKTIMALAAGLEKVLEGSGRYNRILITRPIVPLGNDLGYLPGDKEDTIRPWMQPIYDNLEFLCNEHIQANGCVEYLFNTGKIELEVLTYIRGRSIPRQFIICDEFQNLSPHAVKTILTRRPWMGSTDPVDAREEWCEMLAEDLDWYSIVDEENWEYRTEWHLWDRCRT